MLDSTCNAIGNFIATALLYPTYTIFMATAFLPFFLLDPCIRTFVSGCQPHSCHRHFIDPRPIDRTIHLWTAFHICLAALFGRFSADFNVLCQRRILHSFASNVVLGERFRALSHHYDHSFPLRSKAPKRMKQGASNAASRNLLEYA